MLPIHHKEEQSSNYAFLTNIFPTPGLYHQCCNRYFFQAIENSCEDLGRAYHHYAVHVCSDMILNSSVGCRLPLVMLMFFCSVVQAIGLTRLVEAAEIIDRIMRLKVVGGSEVLEHTTAEQWQQEEFWM